jgi:hypothetical protein
MNMLHVEFPV